MEIVQESPHLARLTRLAMFNCFLVKEADGCTLVDTNLPGSARAILRASIKLGWPIRRIILTHAHFDHVGSLEALTQLLPNVEVFISNRESRLLCGDFSLDPGEDGKPLFGFLHAKTKIRRKLVEGDQVGSLRAVSSAGHTPGHFSFLDVRDNTLIAGDAFLTQQGLMAAGVFYWYFPMPAIFSWNPVLSACSAAKLRDLKPARLAVGHGKSLLAPGPAMDRAVAIALEQHPDAGTL